MSKKNKDIEVTVEEVKRPSGNAHINVQRLSIGKVELGFLIPDGNKFSVEKNGKLLATVNNEAQGYELLISDYNLNSL
ncbi:Protein of unknown function [Pilibacter termitis]|uniref:DUF2969 domain-containing protein n=1 Tax=Pilibacter termitis TaxID=263852 RepID=A0A1T4QF62_9ENTE|nr:DUF2969 family protein [Pilibacter termitis]SKA02354.1 Protein of unknown function [Pilibacter termitis]